MFRTIHFGYSGFFALSVLVQCTLLTCNFSSIVNAHGQVEHHSAGSTTIITTTNTTTNNNNNNNFKQLALKETSPLVRVARARRQAGPVQSQNANPEAQGGSSASNGPADGQAGGLPSGSDAANSDEKPQEETLSALKCDFGSADAPDMCRFKVLENEANPLNKGLSSWTLGSGKLALFQGGPLMDASLGNDTNGGYIFYETSNPYASGSSFHANNSSLSPAPPSTGIVHDYSAIVSSSPRQFQSGRHDQAAALEPFQRVSSPRVSVGSHLAGPSLLSANLSAPGPAGMCLSFQYAIQGLSAEELRIYVNDHKTGRSRQIWASTESAASNWTKGAVLYSVTNKHSLMFSAASWPSAMIKDLQQRKFRGYLALDEIEIDKHDPSGGEGACRGHCNFDGDLCGWSNAENGLEDNFDWSFGRGSENLFTGPARDFTSSSNNDITGSYLFTDSGYPRRPGDRAVLVSPMFQPTAVNDAMCMRLAVHMFGSGIGSLAIKIRYADDSAAAAPSSGSLTSQGGAGGAPPSGFTAADTARAASQEANSRAGADRPADFTIWEMSGDAGNSWHQAQTSVSSSKSPFQVVIEGVIGENHLGNMALDEISFSPGACPTSPPVASKNYGDCTFEQSMCYWRNPDADIHLDDLDWVRTADEQSIHGPNFDHTLKKRSGSYLKLENTFREPKSGTRAFLLSPVFQPKSSASVQCLSFYYYMFMRSISSSGPNLGTIRVYLASNNELVPIWRLTNPISSPNWKHGRASLSSAMVDGEPQAPSKLFQIAFEGIWGDAATGAIALDDITVFDGACDIMPPEAKSVPGECTFDVDLCSWINKTLDLGTTTDGQSMDLSDNSRSPFLQSVTSAAGSGAAQFQPARVSSAAAAAAAAAASGSNKRSMSWQLATVDSRPVNLQDHTYKAPIGYAYVDVLDGGNQPIAFQLQSSEVTVQAGQQVGLCLSFWFAAYGRQDANQLQVYLTQASAPPQPAEDSGSAAPAPPARGPANQAPAGSNQPPGAPSSGSGPGQTAPNGLPSAPAAGSEGEGENANAWKSTNGKLLWSMGLKNVTESNRRKWLYGQVSVRADSNYIVRFVASSTDGGFALDDVSYFEGGCEARPMLARVQSVEDEAADLRSSPPQVLSTPLAAKPTS